MSAGTSTTAPGRGFVGPVSYLRNTALLTERSLRAIPRVPERLLDVTIQPIVFILLFLYVFGSAIHIPGISYKDYLFPGIIGQSLAFNAIGAGVATANDITEGVVDRFRSLPINRLSIISAQVMGQFCEALLGMVIVVVFGLLLGGSAVRDARPLAGRNAGHRLHRCLPAQLHGGNVRADLRHGGRAEDDRSMGSDRGARRERARPHAGRSLERLLAARSPRGRDGTVVPADHRHLRPAGPPAVQQHARRLNERQPA